MALSEDRLVRVLGAFGVFFVIALGVGAIFILGMGIWALFMELIK